MKYSGNELMINLWLASIFHYIIREAYKADNEIKFCLKGSNDEKSAGLVIELDNDSPATGLIMDICSHKGLKCIIETLDNNNNPRPVKIAQIGFYCGNDDL